MVSPYILLLGMALLLVAALRPRTPVAKSSRTTNSIAIAMAVDVSGSMEALDLTPPGEEYSYDTTRLAVVKKLFAEFVKKRPDDLIGLVTFGGYAAAVAPLTADHDALLNVLKGVKIPTVSVDERGVPIVRDEMMTAVGDGLACALARLKDSKLASKIVILLSDGVSNTGAVTPDEAAAAAAKLGVKVYSIGVGTKSRRTPTISRDVFQNRSYITYTDTTFDEGQLKSIAKTTGGMYFSVNDRNSLRNALSEIDKLEKTEIESDTYDRWNEHFSLFLLAGAVLVGLAVFLSVSSTRKIA
jgi:Ca-activated chloride channel family protein